MDLRKTICVQLLVIHQVHRSSMIKVFTILAIVMLTACTPSSHFTIKEGVIIMDQHTSDKILKYIELLPETDLKLQKKPAMNWPKKQKFI